MGCLRDQTKLITVALCGLLLTLLFPTPTLADGGGTQPFTTTYRITFTNTWGPSTHPDPGFPASAHWSPLVGAVHNANVAFWAPGEPATTGIERMAEEGQTSPFVSQDVGPAMTAGTALSSLLGPGVPVPANIGDTATINSFTVNRDYPLVTIVSMIAPSPDWFAGLRGESLLDANGRWRSSHVVDVFPYDAGTEQGTAYSTSNPAEPANKPIASIKGITPFSNEPVGTFTLTPINYSDLHLSKTVIPQTIVDPQTALTFTVILNNSGDTGASGAVLTDTLPAGLVFDRWLSQPTGAMESGGEINWSGAVPAGTGLTFSYVAIYTGPMTVKIISNTARVFHSSAQGVNTDAASASFSVREEGQEETPQSFVYLPLMVKF